MRVYIPLDIYSCPVRRLSHCNCCCALFIYIYLQLYIGVKLAAVFAAYLKPLNVWDTLFTSLLFEEIGIRKQLADLILLSFLLKIKISFSRMHFFRHFVSVSLN